MKKLVCVFFAIALAQGVPTVVESQQIIDPIDRVVNAGLMNKDSSGNFNAEGIISRADLAAFRGAGKLGRDHSRLLDRGLDG